MSSSYTFTAISLPADIAGNARRLNPGSENDEAEEIFRKHFNPGIKSYETGWNSLIGGITAGDTINFTNSQRAKNQLWIHSAESIYLDRRAADVGVIRPASVGISDDVFRRLTIKTTTKKLITQAFLETLEVFYGTDSTRANLTSVTGPYALATDWDLLVSIDGGDTITIPFVTSDFTNINAATATEVAAVITRWLLANDAQAYALEHTDSDTGLDAVRIYSGALGLGSSIQVLGGHAQNILQFPTLLTAVQVSQSWAVQNSTSNPGTVEPGTVRFRVSAATSTTDLNLVFVGDYVNIFGANFNTANQGTFVITNVDVRWSGANLVQFFEVEFDGSFPQSVAQLTTSDMLFFRPTRTTVNDNGSRAVIVAQDSPGEVDVQLPATTIAVSRTALTGAYANVNDAVDVTTVIRQAVGTSLVTTSTNHGLTVGGQVFLDGIIAGNTAATVHAGNGTSTTDAALTTITSILAPENATPVVLPSVVLLANDDVWSGGGRNITAGVPGAASDKCHRLRVTEDTTLSDGSVRYSYSWIASAHLPQTSYYHGASLMIDGSQNGNVFISGGTDATNTWDFSWIYNPTTNLWTTIPGVMSTPRVFHSQITLDDGRILIMGGSDDLVGTTLATCELFSPTVGDPGGSWASTGTLNLARSIFEAIKLNDGTVLVIGGATASDRTETCEIYNPTTETWSYTGSMGYKRVGHKACLLSDGRVFVWGGQGNRPSQPTANVARPQYRQMVSNAIQSQQDTSRRLLSRKHCLYAHSQPSYCDG